MASGRDVDSYGFCHLKITILNGVLSLNDKKAQEIMTPIDDVLCLPADKVLDHATIDAILLSGFSRIPIYEPNQRLNFVGMLLVKRVGGASRTMAFDCAWLMLPFTSQLISYNPEDCKKVSEFSLLSLPEALPDINCEQTTDRRDPARLLTSSLARLPSARLLPDRSRAPFAHLGKAWSSRRRARNRLARRSDRGDHWRRNCR